MADNKKYYYMRFNENYFDNETQVLLESMPDGYLYSNILLKLYLKSLKNDGRLMFNDKIPYSPEMIATITRHKVGVVKQALQIFEELNIIEVLDTGAIYMLDIQNYIGKSNTEADRKRAYRKRIENEKGQMSLNCPLEIEKEIKIEKEIDIEIEKDIEASANLFNFLEENFGRTISPIEYEQVIEWENHFKDEEIIKYAITLCCNNNAKNINYLNAILRSWEQKGYKKLEECKNESLNRQQKNTPTRKEIVPEWLDKEVQREENDELDEELLEFFDGFKEKDESWKEEAEQLKSVLKETYGKE